MNVLGIIFLNSCKDRRKDVKTIFLWDVEELTFLINPPNNCAIARISSTRDTSRGLKLMDEMQLFRIFK